MYKYAKVIKIKTLKQISQKIKKKKNKKVKSISYTKTAIMTTKCDIRGRLGGIKKYHFVSGVIFE